MKITAIRSLVCNARMRNWVSVKVETDQPGLIGWGEATLEVCLAIVESARTHAEVRLTRQTALPT